VQIEQFDKLFEGAFYKKIDTLKVATDNFYKLGDRCSFQIETCKCGYNKIVENNSLVF
jgi:hypothetical protein